MTSRLEYEWLRRDYGPQVGDDRAGESMLLDTDSRLAGEDLSGGMIVEAETLRGSARGSGGPGRRPDRRVR